MGKNYFEIVYKGPFKGYNITLPEDVIPIEYSPFCNNFTLKHGEIGTRMRQQNMIPGTPDGNPILTIQSFLDQNNVFHTVAITSIGLWQLNPGWNNSRPTPNGTWNLVGSFLNQPGPNIVVNHATFVDKFFWTNGGPHLYMWDGISSLNAPRLWGAGNQHLQGDIIKDSNGNIQVANNSGASKTGSAPVWANTLGGQTTDGTIIWTENGKFLNSNGFVDACIVDATNGLTAGGLFLIELNAQLLLLNTVEAGGNFPQRVRWCPSGLPTIWDPNVNLGAGFNDELDVPDTITGAFTVGTTGFVLRTNGITEITSNGQQQNPFDFNHLWASDRGIGNVLPYGYASYGPLGIIISEDDIYNISLGGFKRIGGNVVDDLFTDISNAIQPPIGCIIPRYSQNYLYNNYCLSIGQRGLNVNWRFSFDDESWVRETKINANYTGRTTSVITS